MDSIEAATPHASDAATELVVEIGQMALTATIAATARMAARPAPKGEGN
jgi:hypothetical protein